MCVVGSERQGFTPLLTQESEPGAFAVGSRVRGMEGFRAKWKQGQICISKEALGQLPSPTQLCNTGGTFHNIF